MSRAYTSSDMVENGIEYTVCYYRDGSVVWYQRGTAMWHREGDLPAHISGTGTQEWWINDEYHRESGPAIIYEDGVKEWWFHGEHLTQITCQAEFEQWLKLRAFL